MRTAGPQRAGFTLIEMIGVLAIMSILAAVIVPNVLKSVERAAMKAEVQNAQSLGESVKLYLKTYKRLPTADLTPDFGKWSQELAMVSDLSPTDIAQTKWGSSRTYVIEPIVSPATRPLRVMILSSMRNGLAVPTATRLRSTTSQFFNDIWNTPDGVIPSGATAGLWNGWSAATAGLLVVQRINLAPIYNSDLQTFSVTLNNQHATQQVRYLYTAYGTSSGMPQILAPKASVTLQNIQPKDRIDLYSDAGGSVLNYSQVFSASSAQPVSFRFDATLGQWMTQ